MNSADRGIGFPKGLNWIAHPHGFTGVGSTGQGLGESTMGIRQRSIRTCCDSTTCLVFVLPNTSPSTQRPPLLLRMSQLPPQRRGRTFLLGNKGAWVITALPVVFTAGWHKSHWKCLNYIINLQVINFPPLTQEDLIDKLLLLFFMLPWCLLLFSFQNGAQIRPFGIKYVWLRSPQMDQNNLNQWKVSEVELDFTVCMCAWSVSSAMFK